MSNLLGEIEGKLPEDKPEMLKTIEKYKNMLPLERLNLRLQRRLQSYLAVYGGLEHELNLKVQEALESIQKELPDAETRANNAISALKAGFV